MMNIYKSYIILFLMVLVACSDKNGSNYQDATTIEYQDFAVSQYVNQWTYLLNHQEIVILWLFKKYQ